MKTSLSAFLKFGVAAMLAVSAAASHAQAANYPNRPIRIIVPFPAGGATSVLAHMLSEKLKERWGQPVIVDNRAGGNTIIGSSALVKSPADGYTIMMQASTHAANPALLPLPYDTVKDFAPVACLVANEYMLVVPRSSPANDLKQFIALAKAKPGELNYASTGTASPQHLAGELFAVLTGVKIQHIPYKGSGQLIPDLIGGQVQFAFVNPANVVQHIKVNGSLKALAISGRTRSPALPNVPTFEQDGLQKFDVRNWFGVLAPAGTPQAIVETLQAGFAAAMALPDVREKVAALGFVPFVTTPDEFAALIKTDMENYARLIATANVKLDK